MDRVDLFRDLNVQISVERRPSRVVRRMSLLPVTYYPLFSLDSDKTINHNIANMEGDVLGMKYY